VNELVAGLGLSQPGVSKHLRVLREAGLVGVRVDRRLRHPIERVWEALTDLDELRRWRNTDEDGNVATLDGTITGIGPPRLLAISADWGSTAPGQPGTRTHLTWELEPDGDHTLLRFTNQVDAPAQDVRTAAGWHLHLDALPADLFAPLQQAYTEKYGRARSRARRPAQSRVGCPRPDRR
jgi:uncharacterized protein YndB with AHSA1/START domain